MVDHPDITIKQADSQKDGQSEGLAAPDLSNPLTPVFLSHANERLLTTEHRVWHALTDHDVDWKRVPKLEFICLQVIAAAGRQGILQPDVTRLTGQDKRSVPKRTDSLASKGYITKELCLGGGIKTSILRLKKLVQEGPTETIMVVKGEAGRGEGGTRSMINYEQWYGEVIATLKKHNGIIAYEDLRKEMVRVSEDLSCAEILTNDRAFMACVGRPELFIDVSRGLKRADVSDDSRLNWKTMTHILKSKTGNANVASLRTGNLTTMLMRT